MRTVALASGRGSNFAAVLAAVQAGTLSQVEIVGLVTDRTNTGAAALARENSISLREVDFGTYQDRAQYNEDFASAVREFSPDLVLALGYMRILDADFVGEYRGRLINVHPSLLPAFPGMRAQRQAFEYGVKLAGCTVHYVDVGVDSGPIIAQRAIAVPEGCDLDQLEALILGLEHETLVEAVGLHSAGLLRIEGRRVLRNRNG